MKAHTLAPLSQYVSCLLITEFTQDPAQCIGPPKCMGGTDTVTPGQSRISHLTAAHVKVSKGSWLSGV